MLSALYFVFCAPILIYYPSFYISRIGTFGDWFRILARLITGGLWKPSPWRHVLYELRFLPVVRRGRIVAVMRLGPMSL